MVEAVVVLFPKKDLISGYFAAKSGWKIDASNTSKFSIVPFPVGKPKIRVDVFWENLFGAWFNKFCKVAISNW